MVVLNNLTTVDNLTVPLGLDDIKDELGILRLVGINFFAIKQIKGIQHGSCLPSTMLSGDGPQSLLRGLSTIFIGNQD